MARKKPTPATSSSALGRQKKSAATRKEPRKAPARLPLVHGESPRTPQKLAAANAQLQARIAELEATADDLGSILRNTSIAVIFLDLDFRLRRFTPMVADLFELSPSKIGRPFGQLIRKFEDERLLSDARDVLKSLAPLETEVTSASGRAYLRRVLPWRSSDQRLDGVVITFVDITGRKRAETALHASEARHRLILDGIKDYAIFLIEPDGRIASWTQSAERIFGITSAEAIGQPLSIIFPVEHRDPALLVSELETARQKGRVSEDGWHTRRDGSRFWASSLLTPLQDDAGRPCGFVKILRDNSEHHLIEQALRRAKSEAEAANHAKDAFLANISHELRTPLSATLLWAKLLNRQANLEPAQYREGLDAIEKASLEQQALIEDLVDTSRIVAGKLRLKLRAVELVPLAQSVIEIARPSAREKGVVLEESIDPQAGLVHADPHRIQQILGNLLSNAIKFTPRNGRVRLRLIRQGDQIEVQVSDTGKGISAEFLPHMFERFTQAETAESSQGGLGLGLSIARQLTELHGGTISVESEGLAKGAIFTIRLPFAPMPKPVPPAAAKPASLRGIRVLLVEDDEETRRALAANLAEVGAKVTLADSVPRALKEFNSRQPDIILSDIGLGKLSGHDFIGQVRAWEKAQKVTRVPAVALTAYADEKNRLLALKGGFQRVLTKPIEPARLVLVLAELVEPGAAP